MVEKMCWIREVWPEGKSHTHTHTHTNTHTHIWQTSVKSDLEERHTHKHTKTHKHKHTNIWQSSLKTTMCVLQSRAFGLVPWESLEVKTRLIFNLHSFQKRCNLRRMLRRHLAVIAPIFQPTTRKAIGKYKQPNLV